MLEAYIGIANSNYKLADYEATSIWAEKTIRLAQKLNEDSFIALALTQMGNVVLNQKDFNGALNYFNKALEIQTAQEDSSKVAANLNNIGNVYLQSRNYDKAEEYFRRTITIDSALGSISYLAGDYNNLGLVMKNRGELNRALAYQLRSLEINERLSIPFGIAGNLNNIGTVYMHLEDFGLSEDYYLRCLELTDSLGFISTHKDGLANLAELYSQLGRYQEANDLLKQLVEVMSEVYNEDVAKKLTSFNNAYDIMEKEAEISSLRQREELNSLLNQRQRLWYFTILLVVVVIGLVSVWWIRMRALKDRHSMELEIKSQQLQALQLQMNPHFLFNTLGAIGSFIHDNERDEASKYLSKFSKLMRNILESSRSPTITLSKEVLMLDRYLELEALRSEQSFSHSIDFPQQLESFQIPTMIIQPFVENAVIHGVRKLRGE